MWFKVFKSIVVGATILFGFSGCGGGGSSDGGGAKLAAPTYENALKVEEAIFSNEINSHTYRAKELDDKQKANPLVLNIAKEYIKLDSLNKPKYRVVSEVCQSGTLDVSVIEESATSKTYLYRYNNCNDGTKTINGTVKLVLAQKSGDIYYRQIITFQDGYRVVYPNGVNVSIADGGVIDITITNYLSPTNYTFVLNTTMKITQNGYSYGYEGMQLNYIVDGNSTYWYETAGVIYINNYKEYVLWDKSYDMFNTPFKVDENGYPISGEARYQMDGAILRIIADNGLVILDL